MMVRRSLILSETQPAGRVADIIAIPNTASNIPIWARVKPISSFRESGKRFVDDHFFDGYETAASICIEAITKRIAELNEQIIEGKFLSNQDQYLMAKLDELKREIEDRLHNFDSI